MLPDENTLNQIQFQEKIKCKQKFFSALDFKKKNTRYKFIFKYLYFDKNNMKEDYIFEIKMKILHLNAHVFSSEETFAIYNFYLP
jgi:hypothetical protein